VIFAVIFVSDVCVYLRSTNIQKLSDAMTQYHSLAIPVSKGVSRCLAIAALAATGIALGWAPDLSAGILTPQWGRAAHALWFDTAAKQANISEADIRNYARAVLSIEARRQAAFQAMQQVLPNRQVPNIRCDERSSLNGLPREARQIAVDYCTESQQVVEDLGLTIDQFNRITAAQQNDGNLADRIRRELIRLQENR
jgi:hypothetical protein